MRTDEHSPRIYLTTFWQVVSVGPRAYASLRPRLFMSARIARFTPKWRTFAAVSPMSAKGHKRTFHYLFDYIVVR
jgi:hypothetical protein